MLTDVADDLGMARQLHLHSLFVHWKEIVDVLVSDHAEPLRIVDGVLWVEVDTSAWMNQFQYQKIIILEQLNEFLRIQKLDDIRFVLKREEEPEEEEKKIVFIPPDPEEVEKFEKLFEVIEDEKSRHALLSFWYLCQSCRRV